MARRGAAVVGEDREFARKRSGEPDPRADPRSVGEDSGGRQEWPEVEWEVEGPGVSGGSVASRQDPVRRPRRLPAEVVQELGGWVEPRMAPRLVARLEDAAGAYERDRYSDAQRILYPLIRTAPDAPALRELMGLCLYRQGKWGDAIRQLEEFRRLSGSLDQHPVLADCHRALGHRSAVAELWNELREGSPSPELVAEGRIVMAESLAEEGKLEEAMALLARSLRPNRVTRDRHLRQWYALADLYERSGDLARARELFARVAIHDPGLSDVAQRVKALT